jgi:endonuclease/exonuclease/phosphatase family metal-dependent hydrolase
MHIRVATLNTWGLPEPLSRQPEQRMRSIGARLPDLSLDVIAFQEVWTAGVRRRLRRAGREAGLVHAWGPAARIGGSGLLLLSRWPILASRLTAFSLRGHPERVTHGDYYGQKGYAWLRLATPAGPISVVDTHLHARYTSDVSHEYVPQRVGQIVQLALGTQSITEPLIAAGDFNFTDRHVEHGLLTDLTGLRDVARETGNAQATVLHTNPLRNSQKPDRRVDYVFARDGEHARVVTRSVQRIFDGPVPQPAGAYSDHAGVLADLEILPAQRPVTAWTPPPEAIERARQLLAQGRSAARHRRTDGRVVTGAGLGFATLVAVGRRKLPAASRRGFLRAGLQAAALLALTPSVGGSVLSEVFAPNEIRAYESLSLALERLQPRGPSRVAENLAQLRAGPPAPRR